jgi:hypothetical protein
MACLEANTKGCAWAEFEKYSTQQSRKKRDLKIRGIFILKIFEQPLEP